jgi:hypothetical protein
MRLWEGPRNTLRSGVAAVLRLSPGRRVLALLGTARFVGLNFPILGVSGALVGGLVASRRPGNPVGWFSSQAP